MSGAFFWPTPRGIRYFEAMDWDLTTWIKTVLAEDIADGDHTTLATIPADRTGSARLLVKEKGIVAGVEVARQIFEIFDPSLTFEQLMHDGDQVDPGDIVFRVHGSSRSLLTIERTVLNIMQRMSGIATKTNLIVDIIKGTGARLLDTRKTTPGMRFLEKQAVVIGGGTNHRFGLYDMMMIKDNHNDHAGGITAAIGRAKAYQQEKGINIPIEVEARDAEEVREILAAGPVDRIMLDNFPPEAIRAILPEIGDQIETEASGGITEATIRSYAETGVDFISVGALTHSVKSLDLSLKAIHA